MCYLTSVLESIDFEHPTSIVVNLASQKNSQYRMENSSLVSRTVCGLLDRDRQVCLSHGFHEGGKETMAVCCMRTGRSAAWCCEISSCCPIAVSQPKYRDAQTDCLFLLTGSRRRQKRRLPDWRKRPNEQPGKQRKRSKDWKERYGVQRSHNPDSCKSYELELSA